MLEGHKIKKNLIVLLNIFFIYNKVPLADINKTVEYECISEIGVSGLFQNQRKFLKETKFFPYKTLMIFSKNYTVLKEKDNTLKNGTEVKYQFECIKNKDKSLLSCSPKLLGSTYKIIFSLDSLRYRKSLITDYWIQGKGNEVDYVHISLGYCYILES